jgi:plastocyanin
VPNYNGFQAQPDPANPGQLMLVYNPNSYIAADDPFVTSAYPAGQPKHMGCMNEPSWALPVLSTPSNNGSADWAGQAFSQDLGLLFIPYGYNPAAHDLSESSNGLRATGQYQTGGILALSGTTGLVVWRQEGSATQGGGVIGQDDAHGNTPLTTASDLLFVDQTDGYLVAMDATNGNVLWKFQTGAPGSSGVITYMAGGQQYIAVLAAGTGIPYSAAGGDTLWAFALGGSAVYTNSAGAVVSGSSEAPTPAPLVIRRPVSGSPTNGSTTNPPNTILLARTSASPTAAKDSTSTSAMFPQQLQVPVGTTVTFLNPGPSGTDTGNTKPHCATQFFEGLFNPTLNPGQSFQYTFTQAGEYFYNDCTDPRPTGKVIVTLTPQAAPLTVLPSVLQLRSPTGVFTGVTGVFQAVLAVPAGWTLATSGPVGSPWRGPVTITTPLTTMPFNAVTSAQSTDGLTLVATFNRADVVNNVPAGLSVPLTVTATFTNSAGTQVQLAGTTNVRVLK